jgi:hypothetical protein
MHEVNAIYQENTARAAAGIPRRTTCGGKPIPEKMLNNTHGKDE